MTLQEELGQGALFDLSARAKLRVTGADCLRFLNGQISNDLRRAKDTVAIHACVLNAKGKINADVFIRADAESFLIDAEPELREPLAARLDRYIIADDVQVSDVTDEFALFHLIGDDSAVLPDLVQTVVADRFAGGGGVDVWVTRERYELVLQQLSALLPLWDAERIDALRIARGIPRWGNELSDEIIPNEASLESRAIDYAKGCYIGQEVISRMKMSGQTNKRLCGLVALGDAPLRPGMRLSAATSDGKDVGWITSVTTTGQNGRQIALGFVKRGFNESGTRLLARSSASGEETGAVEIVPLPFA